MIEVLVASSILVVIVMMLAMLFQQTSMAWRTGVRRADAFMQVRSLIGSIQRDAVKAVDERTIPQALRDKLGGSQSFGNPLSFYTLSANGFEGDNFENGRARRSLSFITYTSTGQRTELILLADGSGKETIQSNVREFLLSPSQNKPKVDEVSFEVQNAPGAPAGALPLSVRMKTSVTSQGYNLEIGAASAGPDGAWGTKDDIRTWAED